MKLKKSQIKEFIRQAIGEVISEIDTENGEEKKPFPPEKGDEEKKQAPPEGGSKKIKTNIEDDPFDKDEVEESIVKRCTVKEIKKWFKTLEENRYKKTYNSDARRVSWLVNNNLSEDYESMPVSMKKKWSKAQYGRERFLAKEFVKHLMTKQMNEQRLRKLIRKVIIKEIRG